MQQRPEHAFKEKEIEDPQEKEKQINEIVREELLWEKYQNLIEFLTMECYPDVPGLMELFKKANNGLTPTDLFLIIEKTLVKDWPGHNLNLAQVRVIVDQVLARAALSSPEYFKDVVDIKGLSTQKLSDAQVDKIYRYCQYFVYIITQL